MIARYLLIALATGAAYALTINDVGGGTDTRLLLITILLVGAAVAGIMPLLAGAEVRLSPVQGVLAAYLLWLVILVYTSTLVENSIVLGWRLATFALIFFAAFALDVERWRLTWVLFILTGAASALWGIGEFLATGVRTNGPVIDPSIWGAMQNLFFFSTVAMYLGVEYERRWQHYLLIAALAVFALGVFAAYSRVGNLIHFVALAFIVLVCARLPDLRRKLAVVVAVSVLSFAVVNSYSSRVEATRHTEGYTLDVQSYGWNQRLLMWESAWAIYEEYPVFGSGPGTFKLHYPRHRSFDERLNSGNAVHNDYLQFLVEGGPVLLAFLVALVGWLLFQLGRGTLGLLRGSRAQLEGVLLIVAMGTPLTHALMNFPLYQLQVQMLLGLLLARVVTVMGRTSVTRIEVASPRFNRGVVTGAVIIAVLPLALDTLTVDLVTDRDKVPALHHLRDDRDTYLSTMLWLTTLRSQNAMNHVGMATIYRISFDSVRDPEGRNSLGVAAALEYERGLEINPYNHEVRGYYAGFLEENPWLVRIDATKWTPETLYRDGVTRAPSVVERYLELAGYLQRTGRGDEAYALLADEALPWVNHRYEGWQQARLELFRRILRGAIERDDRDTLERLLQLQG